ncbi:hypothetical protein ACGFJC_47370 [Nonomuraea fuscirosea]|uniref:hypothetical protein n=1 Tax=Nonomuraea fuscirosea TaxID=1291556 RepID=UPI0037197C29
MARLEDADAVPPLIAWLSAHPDMTAALGGPGRVDGEHEPPYPRLRVADAPGGTDNLDTEIVGQRIQIEALGTVDGPTIGKAALRRILYTALRVARQLPTAPEGSTDTTVVTAISSSTGGGYVELADGRPRYVATITATAHPAR